jgi:hypothetical protein
MVGIIWIIVATVLIMIIYISIKKLVSSSMKLRDTGLNTNLKEFRESHAVSTVICEGYMDFQEGIVQQYERMCIIDPLPYKDNPYIPELIKNYRDIIQGELLDIGGYNIPSETLLGKPNPDYTLYLTNQAKKHKKASLLESSAVMLKESSRVENVQKEKSIKVEFLALLIKQGVPLLIANEALTEGKMNVYTAEDWIRFSNSIKIYVETANQEVVRTFVSLFDEKEIVFNHRKFSNFTTFYEHGVPIPILTEILRDRISVDQALRIIELVSNSGSTWDEGMQTILSLDLKETEETNLRKSYGWKG